MIFREADVDGMKGYVFVSAGTLDVDDSGLHIDAADGLAEEEWF
jgi:hypothetical protein